MNTSQKLAPLFSQLWWMIQLFLIVGAIKAFNLFTGWQTKIGTQLSHGLGGVIGVK